MKIFGCVAVVAVACLLVSPKMAHAGDREYWRHSKGHFENTTGNTWEEKSPDGDFTFQETDRNDDYVELYDKGRDCTVRLYKDTCWVKANFTDNKFKKFWDGKWGSK